MLLKRRSYSNSAIEHKFVCPVYRRLGKLKHHILEERKAYAGPNKENGRLMLKIPNMDDFGGKRFPMRYLG